MSELKVNTISEVTGANGVVIDSVKLKDGGVIIADAGNIGSASDTDAIAIASGGGVTFSQAATFSSTIASTGAITSNAGVVIDNITIDGTEIDLSSGDLTLDVAGDIILDADGGDVKINDGGTAIAELTNSSTDFVIKSVTNDKDIIFKGVDNSSAITALTLDMSAAGAATFNNNVTVGDNLNMTTDSSVIAFGADSEITLTHSADSGLILKHTATADDKPVSLTLQTGETDMAANDVIGKIDFQAPDEATGTDAILVAAGIEAISEGDFSSSANATKLSFKTAASEAAAEKMSLSSAGLLTVANGLTLSDGDVTVASGHGISFAATSDGAGTDTSELLDDYEEGTWSPALNNFGGSNETFIAPRYTKIGRLVTVSCQLQIGSFPSDGSTFALSGLPYTCKNAGGTTFGTVPFRQTNSNIMGLTIGDNNTVMEMYGLDDGGGQFNYNDFGQSKQMAFVAQYETD